MQLWTDRQEGGGLGGCTDVSAQVSVTGATHALAARIQSSWGGGEQTLGPSWEETKPWPQ